MTQRWGDWEIKKPSNAEDIFHYSITPLLHYSITPSLRHSTSCDDLFQEFLEVVDP